MLGEGRWKSTHARRHQQLITQFSGATTQVVINDVTPRLNYLVASILKRHGAMLDCLAVLTTRWADPQFISSAAMQDQIHVSLALATCLGLCIGDDDSKDASSVLFRILDGIPLYLQSAAVYVRVCSPMQETKSIDWFCIAACCFGSLVFFFLFTRVVLSWCHGCCFCIHLPPIRRSLECSSVKRPHNS